MRPGVTPNQRGDQGDRDKPDEQGDETDDESRAADGRAQHEESHGTHPVNSPKERLMIAAPARRASHQSTSTRVMRRRGTGAVPFPRSL